MTGSIELVPILLIGALILSIAARLAMQWKKNHRPQFVTVEDYSRARAAVDSVFVETEAINRIFSTEDMDFISRSGTRDAQQFFLRERTTLAAQWVRRTQKQVAQLMELHMRLASYTSDPNPSFELELWVKYVSFVIVSNLLLLLIWTRGPFKAARIIGYTLRGAEYFCTVFSLRVEDVHPELLHPEQQSLID
jgi:hypothetical protein